MKFNWGLTPEQRHDRIQKLKAKAQKKSEPRRWFAWYPVKVGDGDWRWLEFVERHISYSVETKSIWDSGQGRPRLVRWFSAEYRAIK